VSVVAVIKKRDQGDHNNRKEQEKKETGKKDVLRKEPVKTVKKEKVNRFEQVKKFFKGVISELKKVHWPGRREVVIYTIVVLVAVIFVGVLIWLFDLIFSQVLLLVR